jgi:Tol biopolymer transport system component
MTPLTTDPTPDWSPRWSPDGREIAFYAYRSGNRDIWAMPSRGGPARQLTSNPAQDSNPTWSPDGHEIAFDSLRIGRSGTWLVDAQGGDARFVTATKGGFSEWLPDGRGFVVIKQDSDRLYRVAKDGGEPVLMVPTSERAYTLRFSHDGQSIYYSVVTGPKEKHDFWKVSLGNGKVFRLTRLEGRRGNIGPNFATDGHHLYFTWREDDGDIWVMDVATDARK